MSITLIIRDWETELEHKIDIELSAEESKALWKALGCLTPATVVEWVKALGQLQTRRAIMEEQGRAAPPPPTLRENEYIGETYATMLYCEAIPGSSFCGKEATWIAEWSDRSLPVCSDHLDYARHCHDHDHEYDQGGIVWREIV